MWFVFICPYDSLETLFHMRVLASLCPLSVRRTFSSVQFHTYYSLSETKPLMEHHEVTCNAFFILVARHRRPLTEELVERRQPKRIGTTAISARPNTIRRASSASFAPTSRNSTRRKIASLEVEEEATTMKTMNHVRWTRTDFLKI